MRQEREGRVLEMAYEDCTYYEKLNELLDTMDTTSEEFHQKANELLDEELGGAGADWLAHHYNDAAERLVELIGEGELEEGDYPELKRGAEEEIRIFRKHGYNNEAQWIQDKLDRAEKMLAEM